MKNVIRPVKGTIDFYPDEMAMRTWMYNNIRKVSESFGYQEYEAPLIEPIDLYAAKSGEELVKKQSFVFEDRGGNLIALRPELTPSLARLVAQRQKQLVYPLRWWSYGPFWRYERPQKGRTREFFQWNIDLIGVDSPEADAEIVAIAANLLNTLGLQPDEVGILVNSRKLMDSQLEAMGIPAKDRPEIFRLIDRRDKMSPEAWEANAHDLGISASQFGNLTTLLEDQNLWQKSDELRRFFAAIEALGWSHYTRYAPHIIRGLDYYTGTVFEVWDQDGEFRAILGGGRYDNLVADVGGEPLPAVGFAMGDKVVLEVLKKFHRLPTETELLGAPILVTVFDQERFNASIALAAELRRSGLKVATYPEATKLGKQFKYADRIGARVVIILGPDEIAQGKVAVKDLRRGDQQILLREETAAAIRKLLEREAPS